MEVNQSNDLEFLKAIIFSRVLHLFYHFCHNLTYGESFNADHLLFNDFYNQMSDHYDRLAEYSIAVFGNSILSSEKISTAVSLELSQYEVNTMDTRQMFDTALKLEHEFVEILTDLNSVNMIGLQNMVGDLAESSDVRKYKIQQRLK